MFAVRDLMKGFDFISKDPVNLQFSKGSSFSTFKKEKHRVLVYLPQTNSVVWLDKGDAQ